MTVTTHDDVPFDRDGGRPLAYAGAVASIVEDCAGLPVDAVKLVGGRAGRGLRRAARDPYDGLALAVDGRDERRSAAVPDRAQVGHCRAPDCEPPNGWNI